MIPGEILVNDQLGAIELNQGYESRSIPVANLGDRPIQVGSHYHSTKLMKSCHLIVSRHTDIASTSRQEWQSGLNRGRAALWIWLPFRAIAASLVSAEKSWVIWRNNNDHNLKKNVCRNVRPNRR